MSWKQIIVVSDKDSVHNCCIYDLDTGAVLTKFKSGHSNPRCLSFIHDDYLVSAVSDQKVINVWSVKRSNKLELKIDCAGVIRALAISPKGQFCVGAISKTLYVWEIATGEFCCTLSGHYQDINCIKFASDGRYFVSGAQDKLAIAWDIGSLMNIVITKPMEDQLLNPMHQWRDHSTAVTDVHIGHVALQTRVATVSLDMSCRIYDLFSGSCMYTIFAKESLHAVTMDPFEQHLYLGAASGAIIQIPAPSFHCPKGSVTLSENHSAVFKGHRGAVTCLSVSFDGLHLLSGSDDATAVLWDVRSFRPTQSFRQMGAITNAFIRLCPQSLLMDKPLLPTIIIRPFRFELSKFDAHDIEVKLKPHHLITQREMDDESGYYDTIMEAEENIGESEAEKEEESKLLDSVYTSAVMSVVNANL